MAQTNFCVFREYRGDIGAWWCTWMNGACGRLSRCQNLPVKGRC